MAALCRTRFPLPAAPVRRVVAKVLLSPCERPLAHCSDGRLPPVFYNLSLRACWALPCVLSSPGCSSGHHGGTSGLDRNLRAWKEVGLCVPMQAFWSQALSLSPASDHLQVTQPVCNSCAYFLKWRYGRWDLRTASGAMQIVWITLPKWTKAKSLEQCLTD